MNLKNTLLSLLTATSIFLAPKLAEGVVRWHVHNSENGIPGANCPVIARRISPPDTVYKTTNDITMLTANNTIVGEWVDVVLLGKSFE